MKRILVTGAAGFVGRHMMASLAAISSPSDRIIGIGRGKPKGLPKTIEFRQIDLLDEAVLSAFVTDFNPTDVLHLAAMASVQQLPSAPTETWRINIGGLINIAEAVIKSSTTTNFFFVSSGEVYGQAFLAGHALSELTRPKPLNAYACSKWFGEQILQNLFDRPNIRLIILRPFNHIGPGQDERFVVPAFAGQIARIEAGLVPPILEVGNLEAIRDFLAIGDVVGAYIGLIAQSSAIKSGSIFNIASGYPRSIASVLTDLRRHTIKSFEVRIVPDRMRPSEIPIAAGDASLLKSAIGWEPTEDWDAALASVLAHARGQIERSKI